MSFVIKNNNGSEDDLIQVSIFFHEVKSLGNSKYLTFSEEEAKVRKSKNMPVDILNTKWIKPSWKVNNYLLQSATSYDQMTGQNRLDLIKYQDAIIKTCLKEWDIVDENGNPVMVSPETIDNLPSQIVATMISRYDELTSIKEDDRKN